ncbi:hypothetical protein EWM64_g3959 [Hericium alpestre]|uniref:BTB domain-containing protein n=1 Tax=Hericium alpestre TaxID=135208 RepID=A0A4Z0A2F9_9AGAM|nr:hypothetical protein EWM64_g3959 [Hericium alpestre]
MDTSRPPKRRREDEVVLDLSDSSSSSFTKDVEFWLADGNVVLVCESTGFRVHQSVLSMHSRIFKDMFSMCNPQDNDTFDGCSLIRLPDAADDFSHLLKSLYRLRYPPTHDGQFKLEAAGRLLRIASKYMLDELRKELIDYILVLFPKTLRFQRGRKIFPSDFSGLLGVEISLSCDVPIILPAACHVAASQGGGVLKILDSHGMPHGEASMNARRMVLEFREKMMETLDELCEEFIWSMEDFHCHGPPDTPETCKGLSSAAMHQVELYYRSLSDSVFNFSFRLAVDYTEQPEFDDLCGDCCSKLDYINDMIQRKLWFALPGHCGFKDWAAVEAAQKAADADVGGAEHI